MTGTFLLRLALRQLRTPTPLRFECESGTLGTDMTVEVDAAASGGSVARVTPTTTDFETRATIPVVADSTDLGPYIGDYVLFLACLDNASVVGENAVRFRVIVGWEAGDWSEAASCAAVGTHSLLQLGPFSLPPGSWPEESLHTTKATYSGDYVAIELQTLNTTGSGGGTLDLDAIYLAPKEADGVATCPDLWAAGGDIVVLDWTGETPSGIVTLDGRSLEFGGWVDWEGTDLTLTPNAGAAGVLWGYVYDDLVEAAAPNNELALAFEIEPRWRR